MGSNLLLEATNKTLSKESISHALCLKIQAFKGSYEFFYYSILLQLCQTTQMVGIHVKEFQKAQSQIGSKQYILDGKFFSIATIANVLDLDGEHHIRVWPSHW
jgi:hypothetical protein